MNLPQYITDRRKHCPQCPHATRSRLGGQTGVTLNDRCKRSGFTIRQVYEMPLFSCPEARFQSEKTTPAGTIIVESGRIVGWKEGGGCGC